MLLTILVLQLSKCIIPRLSFEYVLRGQQPFNASSEWIQHINCCFNKVTIIIIWTLFQQQLQRTQHKQKHHTIVNLHQKVKAVNSKQ